MKKTMKQHSFASRLKSLALVFSIGLAFTSCANEDIAQNPNGKDNDANLTTFSTGDPATRTSMESDGKFFWEAGDKIYVKDDNGTWNASSNSPTSKTAYFKFKVPGTYTAHMSYEVYYPGQGSSNDQVVISANQSQAEPNTTTHFGTSGDCGMATATRIASGGNFNFTLDHKAAYLLFLPRTSNTILHDCYLTKVEVNSDNDITSTYTLDPTIGELTGTGTGKQITISTGGSGAYANGFPLTNNATSAATNGAYVVIKPGTHTLKIRYWVKDVVTNVEGTITKTLSSATYDQNKYYNITANLDVRDYDGDHYYMWDAQDQYWYGYEWTHKNPAWQPTIAFGLPGATTSTFFPSTTGSRSYHDGSTLAGFNATQLCASSPNANEMAWYVKKGDPYWDADELWTTMGHLYKGGMWFKKKTKITGFTDANIPDNTSIDLRTQYQTVENNSFNSGQPAASELGNYFFLPSLGLYSNGGLYSIRWGGFYWSSSAKPGSAVQAYSMHFSSISVVVESAYSNNGMRVQPTWFK